MTIVSTGDTTSRERYDRDRRARRDDYWIHSPAHRLHGRSRRGFGCVEQPLAGLIGRCTAYVGRRKVGLMTNGLAG
jgi:hypothetical protein